VALPKGARRHRERGLWQVAPYAAKLTRSHRDPARADQAFERALREQTQYPARIEALIAGRTWFEGKSCERCGTSRRRVYDVSCWTCQRKRTQFETDERGRCVTRWAVSQSRGGYLARQEERRREKAGEYIEYRSGDWSSRQYPTGRLEVRCERLYIDVPDLRTVHRHRLFELGMSNPDLVEIMRRAGWSV
jgi:hypothetical protein